jgi:hypothetical protein
MSETEGEEHFFGYAFLAIVILLIFYLVFGHTLSHFKVKKSFFKKNKFFSPNIGIKIRFT